MRSMVEGRSSGAKMPLHRLSGGPPPLEIEGRIELEQPQLPKAHAFATGEDQMVVKRDA